jgi:hypothetical protein
LAPFIQLDPAHAGHTAHARLAGGLVYTGVDGQKEEM